MPILDAPLIADIRAVIDAEFGSIPPALTGHLILKIGDYRERLAICIAEAAIYSRDNNQVNVGQDVIVHPLGLKDSLNGDVTGTCHGTVDTTGTYS